MRVSQILLLPFYADGYNLETAREQVGRLTGLLEGCGLQVETAPLIGTAAQAGQAAQQYNPYCYDAAILFPVTWSEPRLACMAARQFFGLPLAVWCINGFSWHGRYTEMSSAPAAAALRGCLQEMGVPCEFFAGLEPEADVLERVRAFARAGRAIRMLRQARIGFFGHNFNGITAAGFDLSVLRRRLGTEVWSFDASQLLRRMESCDSGSGAYRAACEQVERKVSGRLGAYRDRVVRMCLALEQYIEEYDLSALNIRCHSELSQDYGMTACLPLSILGDRLPCSCEADLPVMLTQLLLHCLTEGEVTAYVDLRTFERDGMDVGACGFAPCALTGGRARTGVEAPENQAGEGYLTNCAPFVEGRVTLARMLKLPSGVLGLHLTGGQASPMEQNLQEMHCPFYPMARIRPDMPMEQFLERLGANHYALVYADVCRAARLFCKYTGMELFH